MYTTGCSSGLFGLRAQGSEGFGTSTLLLVQDAHADNGEKRHCIGRSGHGGRSSTANCSIPSAKHGER